MGLEAKRNDDLGARLAHSHRFPSNICAKKGVFTHIGTEWGEKCAKRPEIAHISAGRGEICVKMGVFAHIWAESEEKCAERACFAHL